MPPESATLIEDGDRPQYLLDLHYGLLSLHDACSVIYCGSEGVRFHNGIFLAMNLSELVLPHCPETIRVGIVPEWLREESILDLTYEEMEYELCENTLATILSTGKISWDQLARFYPVAPGFHQAYRIRRDGVLEMDLIMFTPGFEHDNQTRITDIERTLEWHDWTETAIGLRGPSGILRTPEGAVIIPHSRIHKGMLSSRDVTPNLIFPPRHPSHIVIPDHKEPLFNPRQMEEDLITYSPIQDFLSKLVKYGLPCFASLVACWILYKIGTKCRSGYQSYAADKTIKSNIVINCQPKIVRKQSYEMTPLNC